MAIQLTEKAADAVKGTMERQGLSAGSTYLRVSVSGGGCSGFSYALGFTSEKEEGDQEFDCNGVKVLCDPQGYTYLNGTRIDYRDDMVQQGFAFENPNATGSCGCGKSFSA